MSCEEADTIEFYLEKITQTAGYRKDFSGTRGTSRRPDGRRQRSFGEGALDSSEELEAKFRRMTAELSNDFDVRVTKREASRMAWSFSQEHSG